MPAVTALEHASEVGLVADIVMSEVRSAAMRADADDVDLWWDWESESIMSTVARAFGVAAKMASRYLTTAALFNGLEIEPLVVAADLGQIGEALRVTGPVAFKTNVRRHGDPASARGVMAERLAGSANRLTLAGSRQTIVETANRSPAITRYRRVAQPGACDFCEMLAGRGAVYTSAASAGSVTGRQGKPRGNRRITESYHDHCRCYVEVEWVDA